MKELAGKVAVVTGAGSAIALVDINPEALALVVDELRRSGATPLPYEADVSDEASIKSLVAAVTTHHDQVDILVNNAGVVALGRFEDASLEDFARCCPLDPPRNG